MAEQYIFTMNDLRKVRGDKEILKGIYLSFFPGAKIGVLGENGSGKSTMLRIMAGVDKEFIGEARPDPSIRIGYLPQEPELDPNLDVKGNVMLGLKELGEALERYNEISMAFAEPMDDAAMEKLLAEQAEVQDFIEANNGWEVDSILERAMDALRCPPGDSSVAHLSGGEKRRVALCKVLLEKPDLLLLDEPTNHLDAESVAWLEQFLAKFEGTIVAITHDRYFLDNVAQWILELERGMGHPFKGNYSGWLEQKQKRLQQEEKQESVRQRTLKRELEWVNMGQKARQAKGKARLNAYDELLKQDQDKARSTGAIVIPPGPRLGDLVIEAKGVSKGFSERMLVENMSFKFPKSSIVGVIGPNGAGKSTLFRMITGEETPDSGELLIGDSVQLAYVEQSREDLDGEKTAFEELSGGVDFIEVGGKNVNARAYLSSFAFKGADQQKRVKDLSGGERNRLHMAKLLKQGANVILLDEPTNDLDVGTLRSLEEALQNFAGCAVVVSHDRWFLNRVATHILAFEGDSQVVFVDGNYDDYEADKKKRLGADALIPKRIKYRKFVA